jgi:hypothetical protein
MLDENEEEDDLTKPYWMLKRPPKFIAVKPDGSNLGPVVIEDICPSGSLPVKSVTHEFWVSDAMALLCCPL